MKHTSKEVLIAYCTTLSEKKCKEAYQVLLERFEIHKARCLTFSRGGVETKPPEGKIRLTPNQFNMILETYGEQGFHRLCEILYDYIVYLEERAPIEVTARRRLKEYQTISHYYKLTKGWVAERYEQEHPVPTTKLENECLSFEDINSKSDAIKFIKSIPSHLRMDNKEIAFLVMYYGIDINKDI